MKVYLASRYSRRGELQCYARELGVLGIECTSRWLGPSGEQEKNPSVEHRQKCAKIDIDDVDACDTLVLFTEPKGTPVTGGGRHFEAGYAFAKGKRIMVVGSREHIFLEMDSVSLFESWQDALNQIEYEDYQATYQENNQDAAMIAAQNSSSWHPLAVKLNSILISNTQHGLLCFYSKLVEAAELCAKKNADYGSTADPFSNFRSAEQIGIPAWKGAWLRAKDKVARIDAFCRTGTLKNEGVLDSFVDLGNYSFLSSVLFEEALESETKSKEPEFPF